MPSCPHTLQDIYNDTVYITSFDPNPPSKTLNPVTTPIKVQYPLYPSSPDLHLVHHVGAQGSERMSVFLSDDGASLAHRQRCALSRQALGACHAVAVVEVRGSVNARINSFSESPFSFKFGV